VTAFVVCALVGTLGPSQAAPVDQIDEDVVVAITAPQPGQRLRGNVVITGYAADRRSAIGSGLNERDIQVYLNDSADERALLDIARPGQDSPAAAAALGPRFGQVGFQSTAWQTCSFPPGAYTVFVWVSSLTTPGARNVAQANVEIEACPAGEILHQDALESPPARVPPNQASLVGQDHTIYGDFAVGVSGRCVVPRVDCLYGFNLRDLPGPQGTLTNSYYNIELDQPNRTFALHFFPFTERASPSGLRLEYLQPWTFAAPIRSGTEFNRLAVIAQGERLQVFVNGQPVGEARDRRRPWGQIAWMANSIANPIEVEFRDLVVSTVGPPELLTPVLGGP
jgi:hypothetical protein